MSQPRVLIIGAGSIGARHARNLLDLGAAVSVTDPDPTRKTTTGAKRVAADNLASYDGILIASPTRLHATHLALSLDAGTKVLVEKPLGVTVAECERAVREPDQVMVGYNLRFHEPIRRLHELTADGMIGAVRAARFWFGSYLPDWRPGTDYRSSYSARSDLGGGVLLDATHELDLVTWWFGMELRVTGAFVGRVGPLEIDVEDTVKALLETPAGVPIEISLDYLSRRYRRGIELIGDLGTLRLDWSRQQIEIETAHTLEVLDAPTRIDDSYVAEDAHFLSWLEGKVAPEVDGAAGAASVAIAEAIRSAACEPR